MKRARILALIATALALVASGCGKKPKNVTWLKEPEKQPGSEGPSSQIPPGPGSPGAGNTLSDANTMRTRPIPNATPGIDGGTDMAPPIAVRPMGIEDTEVLKAHTVYFEYDKSSIRPAERPKLQAVAAFLKNNPKVMLKIEGNCDERGTEEYNRALGERRAIAARDFLVSAEHVDSSKITTASFGEDKPSDPGHNEAAWSKNRRDDFVIVNQP